MWDFENIFGIINTKSMFCWSWFVTYLHIYSIFYVFSYLPKSKETVLSTFVKYVMF